MHPLLNFFILPLCVKASLASSVIPKGMDPDIFFDQLGENRTIKREDLNNGKLTSSIGTSGEGVRAMILQTDGKIMMVGRTNLGTQSDFAVIRVQPDGQLDASFNGTGKMQVSFGSGDDWAHAATLQADGKVVLVGKSEAANAAGNHDFAVARINTNGTLDTAFNTTGKVAFSIGNSVDIARAVTLDTSARMLIAGYSWMGTQYDSVFAKLNTNGTLDTAFNSTGKKVFTVTASDNAFLGIEVGMAIAFAAGPAYDGAKWSTGVRRVDDGNGGNFPSAIISGANDIKLSVVKLAVGGTTINYLAGSESNGSNLDFVVYRMVADSLDTAFNTTGRFIASFGGGDDAASSIRVQTDGRVIVAGYGNDGSKDNFAVIRLKTDGTLDTSFFTTGKSSLSIGSGQDRVQGMDLLNDGNIVIGGRSWNGSNFDFGIIRLNFDGTAKKSGDLDLSFGTD